MTYLIKTMIQQHFEVTSKIFQVGEAMGLVYVRYDQKQVTELSREN